MTTVFLLLSDIRAVLFTLARNLLHLHMASGISDQRVCRISMCSQLGFLDARLQLCVHICKPHKPQMLSCVCIASHTFPRGAVRICKVA